ncbi:MAG: phosphoribosylformylglycinamidine synthase [Clostridia bacterium]|nr:phosphoribosylformylglycinamidine synthase [Clostridia bacterium]
MVQRVYVEKRALHALEAEHLLAEFQESLGIKGLKRVRTLNRYDTEGVAEGVYDRAKTCVFSEPQTDVVTDEIDLQKADYVLAVEYLPGQYDQRADFCAQCIETLGSTRPLVRTARIYLFYGKLKKSECDMIRTHLLNPVECREASMDLPATLKDEIPEVGKVPVLEGFCELEGEALSEFLKQHSLAMDTEDLVFLRDWFKDRLHRDPTETELKLLDTYWSDHCRHTTFTTAIDSVEIGAPYIAEAFEAYRAARAKVYGKREKDVTLMDLATVGTKFLKKEGYLPFLDESEEINACSIKISAKTKKGNEPWLLMFKNETHNHPTEIEPFGGAATCLGGAIRDPLSGRSYVYQSMRVTGAGDPTVPISETLPGKLPQKRLTVTAAHGFSSYGNQIGLATGGVTEYYHPGYVAKRMELGAVIAAAPAKNVVREVPRGGDRVILLGGATGRDGCGGATGSSKAHNKDSLTTCGAEVQKGNPPEERKIQRLFRNPEVSRMIKRCNDFGAGGVSVAIGELADGLYIDLDRVPKKYEGLSGTELAISESQERMAVVVAQRDVNAFIEYAKAENLSATVVAAVTDDDTMTMQFGEDTIVSLPRELLNSAGAKKHTDIVIDSPNTQGLFDGLYRYFENKPVSEAFYEFLSDLNLCSQKGLVERFDASIGASSVLLPFGGLYRMTPTQAMAALLPVDGGTTTAGIMAHGFDPYLCEKSPYHGGLYAVVESATKLVASGASPELCSLSLQEFFPRTNRDPRRFGLPAAALLGAFTAQMGLKAAAIGGKDSMSGSFEDLDVPPTLVSFAVSKMEADEVVTPEFKAGDHPVYLLKPRYDENGIVDFEDLKRLFVYVNRLMRAGKIVSAYSVSAGGALDAMTKMALGNRVGVEIFEEDLKVLTAATYGSFVVEATGEIEGDVIGMTRNDGIIVLCGERFDLREVGKAWEKKLSSVFPVEIASQRSERVENVSYDKRHTCRVLHTAARPRVLIPVFPGTNCEYDTARAFEKYGAEAEIFVLTNRTPTQFAESVFALCKKLSDSQILMLPGGFSAGDEPDGSAKFITAVLRNAAVSESVHELLSRDGLILGICNGFQALVKSGLLPFGQIKSEMSESDATLTYNRIGRHQSMSVPTRVASVHSPWMAGFEVGEVHTVPISHGEGRFCAPKQLLDQLIANGQVAFQYVDLQGQATTDIRFNPNGSDLAIEGILSPDGRILGKMGHSERVGDLLQKNLPDATADQLKIFESGVRYFKG